MEEAKAKISLIYYLVFVWHVVFIILWFSCWLWLPWPFIVLLSMALYLQSKRLGYCVVTRWQFGTRDKSFWVHYLGKLGIKVTRKQVDVFTIRYLVISPILGWVWQSLVQ